MSKQSDDLGPVFKVLADPTRRAVLERLCRGPTAVSDLAAPFDMALPSFMQHLKQMEAAGLVTSTKTGRVRTYALHGATLRRAEGWLAQQRALWERRLDRLDAYLAQMQENEP